MKHLLVGTTCSQFYFIKSTLFHKVKFATLSFNSPSPAMIMEYSRCDIGKRCVIKTDSNFVFKKFTLLSAISNKKCLGWILLSSYSIYKQ